MGDRVLAGAEKYAASAAAREPVKKTRGMQLIDRANAIPIFDVLVDFFNIDHPRTGGSYKGYCPFSWEHDDGGTDKGWRTYPASNTSHCFPMHGLLTPVRLVQIKYNRKAVPAAEWLLRHYDLLRPKPWRERYEALLVEREQQERSAGNPQHAVEALSMALQGVEGYQTRQFDADVMRGMELVLEKLNAVIAEGDPRELQEWYRKAKAGMTKVIELGGKT